MTLFDKLNEIVKEAFSKCGYEIEGKVIKLSDRPDLSQFQCNCAFEKAKELKMNPRLVADKVCEEIKNANIFSDVSVAGPRIY